MEARAARSGRALGIYSYSVSSLYGSMCSGDKDCGAPKKSETKKMILIQRYGNAKFTP